MKSVIGNFYEAFKNLDAEGMVACYHNDVVFEDPAFGILHGDKAKNMWRMLCATQKGKDFYVAPSNISFENKIGKAHWEAKYKFGKTGRKVHNKIDAEFEFKDGKIIKHKDSFNLYKWSQQALGFNGYLLGWTPFFKNKLQTKTNNLLSSFEQKNKL